MYNRPGNDCRECPPGAKTHQRLVVCQCGLFTAILIESLPQTTEVYGRGWCEPRAVLVFNSSY
jgi:hypothetical protein